MSKASLKQSMILAAGLSTRLRPITDHLPKPLVPFHDGCILDFTMAYLAYHGITSASVNIHHAKEAFLRHLKAHPPRIDTATFVEDQILGTGGGILNMAPFIQDDHFAVVNCDFFTDADLKKAFSFHVENGALATMVLVSNADTEKYGWVEAGKQGRISHFSYLDRSRKPIDNENRGVFSGIHIFSREIFKEMPSEKKFCIVRDVYTPLMKKEAPIYGYCTKARWLDVGEIKGYHDVQKELRENPLSWMKER